MIFTAKQIAEFLNGVVDGNPNAEVETFSKIEEGLPRTISFLSNPKYTSYIYTTKADIVLVNNDFVPDKPLETTLIRVQNAYAALASLLELANKSTPQKQGVDSKCSISKSAKYGSDIYIGAFTVIEENTFIGDNVKIYPQVYIGDNVKIGNNTIIFAGVKIYKDCVIGDNCIIHSGAVIGADGFGFSLEETGYHKIPQMGNVIIEDNVEIGANTTIDRAVMGSTIIREGVKLDNLIQIAHNCEIGKNTAMAAQTGIAGSTKIGDNCVLGGQVGIGGHITLGNNTQIGAKSGIISNTKDGSALMGYPAVPVKSFFRSSIIVPKLPDMYRQVNALEKEIESLKKQIASK